MKTTQTAVAVALSSLALSVFAGGFPGNPERDVVDQSIGTSITSGNVEDGWKDFGPERGVQFVGGGTVQAGGVSHAYTKEEMLQARMDYRESPN